MNCIFVHIERFSVLKMNLFTTERQKQKEYYLVDKIKVFCNTFKTGLAKISRLIDQRFVLYKI